MFDLNQRLLNSLIELVFLQIYDTVRKHLIIDQFVLKVLINQLLRLYFEFFIESLLRYFIDLFTQLNKLRVLILIQFFDKNNQNLNDLNLDFYRVVLFQDFDREVIIIV